MELAGSCHCGAVRFTVDSRTPYPYMLCYCSICRKTAGGGGYAINLGGDAATLRVQGEDALGVYHARMPGGSVSEAARHFCKHCGSALWLFDPRWPELVHPHASAIDTPLPVPPSRVHVLEDDRVAWAAAASGPDDDHFPGYPAQSIHDWHARRGLLAED